MVAPSLPLSGETSSRAVFEAAMLVLRPVSPLLPLFPLPPLPLLLLADLLLSYPALLLPFCFSETGFLCVAEAILINYPTFGVR